MRPGDLYRSLVRQLREDFAEPVVGLGETALTMASGMANLVPAGWAGVSAPLRGEMPADAVERFHQKYDYTPRTEAGQRILGGVGQGMQQVAETAPAQWAAGQWDKAVTTAPLLAAVGGTIAQVADPTKVGRVGKAATRAAARQKIRLPNGRAVELIVNPDEAAIARAGGELKTLRGADGNVYAWDPGAALHVRVAESLEKQGVKTDAKGWAGKDGLSWETQTPEEAGAEYMRLAEELNARLSGPARSVTAAEFVPADHDTFRAAINDARARMSRADREQVSALPDDFAGKTFLTADGKAGFGVAPDGELIALFKDPDGGISGTMGAALERGVAEGATHLNAFDIKGKLVEGYGKRGAVERSRAPWNYEYASPTWPYDELGTPDYVTMDLPGLQAARDQVPVPGQGVSAVRSGRRKAADKAARDSGGKVTRGDLVDTPEQVAQRVAAARALMAADQRAPFDAAEAARTSLFDRSLIDDAMDGHPGVPQEPLGRLSAQREATQSAIDTRVQDVFHEPENRALLMDQVRRGLELGGETYYPSTYPIRAALEEAGTPEQFRTVIAAHAGTSPQQALPNNMAAQSLVTLAMQRGIPLSDYASIKALGDQLAAQRGHQKYFLGQSHTQNVADLMSGDRIPGKMDKVNSYDSNLLGNFKPGTMDTHESKGATMGSSHYPFYERQKGLAGNEYGAFESQYEEVGKQLGLRGGTAGVQAPRWFGGGVLTGLKAGAGDWLSTFEHMVRYSAERLGRSMKRSELRKFAMDVLQGREALVPYYPTKENPLPRLTKKMERGFVSTEMLAALGATGLAAGGAYYGKGYVEEQKAKQKKRADLMEEMSK